MSRLKLILLGIFMMITVWCHSPQNVVMAAPNFNEKACSVADAEQKVALGCSENRELPKVAQNIINGVISVMGLLAVIMIIMSGQRYATSSGDPQQAAKAKNAIIWSVVGLVVALVSWAAINFVLGAL